MRIALVTGASSGIGAEFCRAADRLGLDEIWMVSRGAARLEEVASSLGTPVRVMALDLTAPDGLESLRSALSGEAPDIRILVNCAGAGRFGRTWEIPAEETGAMIRLNVAALTEVTCMCVPRMTEESSIVEVCSASAYLPLAELNVYAATKAYVKSFTDGLRQELKGRGISVLEVSPGWVDTGFIPLSRGSAAVPDRVFKHTVSKEDVVSRAMRDLARGKRRSVCGLYGRLTVFACRHLPRLATIVWRRSLRLDGPSDALKHR